MFENSIMLAGLGGAVLPLVLHWLNRARQRPPLRWGAMMFLDAPDRRRSFDAARFRQATILLLRIAMVALLAIALAGPAWPGDAAAQHSAGPAGAGAGSTRHRTIVLILDCSGSMMIDEGGRPRLDLAKAAALSELARLGKSDAVSLIRLPYRPGTTVLPPTIDHSALAAQVIDATVIGGTANLPEGLGVAADLLDHYAGRLDATGSPAGATQITLVTDRQAINWRPITDGFARRWRARTHDGRNPTLRIVPVGSALADNVIVDSVAAAVSPVIERQPTEFDVRIRNLGQTPRAQMRLVLRIDAGRELASVLVSMAPHSVQTVPLHATAPAAGNHVLSAALTVPGFTRPRTAQSILDVIHPVKVLLLGSPPPTRPFATLAPTSTPQSDTPASPAGGDLLRATRFVRAALMPYALGGVRRAPDVADVDLRTIDSLDASPLLDTCQVVIVDGVPRISPADAVRLREFVRHGGGLLMAPGPSSAIEDYNRLLNDTPDPLLPVELLPATPADGSLATTLDWLDTDHPVLSFRRGRTDAPPAVIGRYFPVSAAAAPHVRVLAQYAAIGRHAAASMDPPPFLIESHVPGGGRVLLVTTPLDGDWSTLPLTAFYLPWLQSSVRYLAGGAVVDRNVVAGNPLMLDLTPAAVPPAPDGTYRPLHVTRPDGTQDIAAITASPRTTTAPAGAPSLRAVYPDTSIPGVYVLHVPDGRRERLVRFAVQPPPQEADESAHAPFVDLPGAAPIGMSDPWPKMLGAQVVDSGLDDDQAMPANATVSRDRSSALATALLSVMVALGLIELALARRWSAEGT